MKRTFVYRDATSNKFWNIVIYDATQIVNFGKVGTTGRESIKHFASEDKCLKESNKIIAQKLKKGYIETFEIAGSSPQKELSEHEKATRFFWQAIAQSNKAKSAHWQDYSIDKHISTLENYLSELGKDKMVLFEKCLREKLNQLYLAEIAELYIILHCDFEYKNGKIIFDNYLSTDGFIYFRCWLLLKGRRFFNDLIKDINRFISKKYSFNIGDCWAEGLLYVADNAYAKKHANEELSIIGDTVCELYPEVIHYDSVDNVIDRNILGGEELYKSYPKLVKSMCDLRAT